MGTPSHKCCADADGLNVSGSGAIRFVNGHWAPFWPRGLPLALRGRADVFVHACPPPLSISLGHGYVENASATVCGFYEWTGGFEYPYRKRYTDVRCIDKEREWRYIETRTVDGNECEGTTNLDEEPDECFGFAIGDGFLDQIQFADFGGRLYGWNHSIGGAGYAAPGGDSISSVSDALGYSLYAFTPSGGGQEPAWLFISKGSGAYIKVYGAGFCTPVPLRVRFVFTVRKAVGSISAYSLSVHVTAHAFYKEDVTLDVDLASQDPVFAVCSAPGISLMECWWVADVSVKSAAWL